MRTCTFDSFDSADGYDDIIDVRSPAEFAEDHIPGAINLPVLNNEERVIVGTLHRQAGEFEARKTGAGLISANIARHLSAYFDDKPKSYRALVYCWRGGQRSKSLATVLGAVGWQATLIAGGYKTYRAFVRNALEEICTRLSPIVLTGLTGSGKTLILRRMQELGAPQILDLEGLANHRGSLLGDEVRVDNAQQPTQKGFESRLLHALAKLDLERPVFIESESKRIGTLNCPEPLWQKMINSPVALANVSLQERARYLVDDYQHFISSPEQLIGKLPVLKKMHGAGQIEEWIEMTKAQAWLQLSESLLAVHYDPSYRRCSNFNKATFEVEVLRLEQPCIDQTIEELARFEASVTAELSAGPPSQGVVVGD
ncbi:MAG: tRNA 2-selenouridine(34) synthase MnmH [Verrucomicrobiae bacterium]|nr:tRNA 2-selenouridine(34) synthase MnmH [Verrucomicrobiae bacterium]